MSTPPPTKNVVVLGGGGAGVAVARALSKKLNHAQYNLILVDMRPYMVWLPAGARMVVTHNEGFTDSVRSISEVSPINGFELHPEGLVSVRQSLPIRKGNFQAGTKLSHNLLIVVTWKQGKVVGINEAGDRRGGELEFEGGGTLSYEGKRFRPPRSPAAFI